MKLKKPKGVNISDNQWSIMKISNKKEIIREAKKLKKDFYRKERNNGKDTSI